MSEMARDEGHNNEILLDGLLRRGLPAETVMHTVQRLAEDPTLRQHLVDMVASRAVLAAALDQAFSPSAADCVVAQAGFGDYAAGTLGATKTAALSSHLRECALCDLAYQARDLSRTAETDPASERRSIT